MLTKNDLQQIREVVREEVKSEVKEQLKPVKKDLSQIKRTVTTTAKLLDLEQMRQRKRITRIENHLHFSAE